MDRTRISTVSPDLSNIFAPNYRVSIIVVWTAHIDICHLLLVLYLRSQFELRAIVSFFYYPNFCFTVTLE